MREISVSCPESKNSRIRFLPNERNVRLFWKVFIDDVIERVDKISLDSGNLTKSDTVNVCILYAILRTNFPLSSYYVTSFNQL